MRVLWHGEAIAEAGAAADYYHHIQPHLAQRFLDELETALHRILRHPNSYREIQPHIHKCRVAHFPYGVIYRIRPDHIQILAVMHLRRSPGYWKDRRVER